jgi:hypothetical protein
MSLGANKAALMAASAGGVSQITLAMRVMGL